MEDALSLLESSKAIELLVEIDRAFAFHPVDAAAANEISKYKDDDDESGEACRWLDADCWQSRRLVDTPEDATLLPCHCPPAAFLSFLPLFMWVVLRDVMLRNTYRLFLDSFLDRLAIDQRIEVRGWNTSLNMYEKWVLKKFLEFVAEVALADPTYNDLRSKMLDIARQLG